MTGLYLMVTFNTFSAFLKERVFTDVEGEEEPRKEIRLLPIVLALFLALFGFASIFFLHFIPKSTASIILDFRLIICIILS